MPSAIVITAAFAREAEVQRAALGAEQVEPVIITHPLSTLSERDIDARASEIVSQLPRVLLTRGV